jgi:hypothetical protein
LSDQLWRHRDRPRRHNHATFIPWQMTGVVAAALARRLQPADELFRDSRRRTRRPGLDPGNGGIMKTVVLAAFGTIAGLILGAAVGILAGIAWINLASTSDFEGQSAMLVFFTFAPIGSVLGGLTGAIWAGFVAARSRIRMEGDT